MKRGCTIPLIVLTILFKNCTLSHKEYPSYKTKTAFFVTNDHGRHLDTISNGFIGHGDGCDGCRHLFFYASGPDFNSNVVLSRNRNLSDITATIAHLFNLKMEHIQGEVMDELFIESQNE